MERYEFERISPESLGNAMEMIGKDWMLIVTEDEEQGRVNAMTASWGAMGVLWNQNICVCFIRPQRHTYALAEKAERFSIAFLGEDRRDALRLCGSKSGRDTDKLAATGLSTEVIDGVSVIRESEINLICRKLYADDLREDRFIDRELLKNYQNKDYHRMYVCEIETVLRKIERE